MEGSYQFGLVALSYLIASLAGFVALEFATRLRARSTQRQPWLIGGALAMGTGIWSMHFVGMLAFSLPVPISYDIGITFLSWVAAVAVSAIALYIVGYGRLTAWTLAAGALVMGFGVCLMHYGGMFAMRMTPGITYHAGLFAASVVIAVVASGAALLIIAYLKDVGSWKDFALRVAAAMVMGLAVVGMHYTGMAAAEFVDGAMCYGGNDLPADVLSWPTTIGSLLILGFGIWFAVGDARNLAAARLAAQSLESRVRQMAFVDKETGLPNRARLSQLLVERIRDRRPEGFSLITIGLRTHDESAPSVEMLATLRDGLQSALPDAVIARPQADRLVILIDGRDNDIRRRYAPALNKLQRDIRTHSSYALSIGSAHCPSDGENPQWLLLRAAPRFSDLEEADTDIATASARA